MLELAPLILRKLYAGIEPGPHDWCMIVDSTQASTQSAHTTHTHNRKRAIRVPWPQADLSQRTSLAL